MYVPAFACINIGSYVIVYLDCQTYIGYAVYCPMGSLTAFCLLHIKYPFIAKQANKCVLLNPLYV